MRIFLDQGHGGSDGGAVASTGQTEARTNYNVCAFLYGMLTKMGHDVSLARSHHDENITLLERRAKMHSIRPDLVISVHHNAFNTKARGAEVLAQWKDRNGGASKEFATYLLDEFEALGLIRRSVVHQVNSTGDADYYGILRYADEIGAVAVITEFAFIDNDEDLMFINGYDKQELQANAISKAVAKMTAKT